MNIFSPISTEALLFLIEWTILDTARRERREVLMNFYFLMINPFKLKFDIEPVISRDPNGNIYILISSIHRADNRLHSQLKDWLCFNTNQANQTAKRSAATTNKADSECDPSVCETGCPLWDVDVECKLITKVTLLPPGSRLWRAVERRIIR